MNILRIYGQCKRSFVVSIIFMFTLLLFSTACKKQAVVEEKSLRDNWFIISSAEIDKDGKAISSEAIDETNWVKTTVPATVLGALTDAGVYKDPFYGKNLEKIPSEPFQVPWWYRTTFDIENFDTKTEEIRIFVDGINYRANVWLNGTKVASQDTLFGAFRQFELNITDIAKAKGNILAFEIIPPGVRNFYMGFVDWAPTPTDEYMGIYREVRVKRSGKVSLDAPFVATDVNVETLADASLSISSELTNYSNKQKTVTVTGTIEDITFVKEFTLQPNEKTTVWFRSDEFKQLNIKNPRLWWSNGLGEPNMYTLNLELKEGDSVVDGQDTKFGIRKIETYLNENDVRGYKLNGRDVLIKSGGWVDDLFLRYRPEKDRAQVRYAKEMNMNSLRFEGFWGNSQNIYDLCDENGILLMVGWSCQWEWPDYLKLKMEDQREDMSLSIAEVVDLYGVVLTKEEDDLMVNYLTDQVKWLRNHPSIFTWAVGSDAMPAPHLEKRYKKVLDKYDDTRSLLVSAGEFTSEVSGKSGMKMNGPYEYVPPVYWFEDKKYGGAFGFNSETGPGPQVPPVESIKKMMPEEYWWPPVNDMWNYHSGRKDFNSIAVYTKAMDNKYGKSANLEEFAFKAQVMNYEAMRPMFEAFVINRETATGVVQWMYNSPWPEFYWQLYDYYLMPTGAYFGTQKACQPINMIYNYDNHKVYASNDTRESVEGYEAVVTLYDINSKKVFEKSEKLTLSENTTDELLKLPKLKGTRQVYFLDLKMKDKSGKVVVSNFYWLATKTDKVDHAKYVWFYTPQKQYADFTKLNSMKKVKIEASKEVVKKGDEWVVDITLKNPTNNIAFFIEMNAVGKSNNASILPVFWNDNYVSLVPGESKKMTVKFSGKDLGSDEPIIKIQGYNLEESIVL